MDDVRERILLYHRHARAVSDAQLVVARLRTEGLFTKRYPKGTMVLVHKDSGFRVAVVVGKFEPPVSNFYFTVTADGESLPVFELDQAWVIPDDII